jgi:hypothetical protein
MPAQLLVIGSVAVLAVVVAGALAVGAAIVLIEVARSDEDGDADDDEIADPPAGARRGGRRH